MEPEPTSPQQLPYPYNQDLSDVLHHLKRVTVWARNNLANSPVTAAYLAAAMRLVERHLGPASNPEAEDGEDSVDQSVLYFLSQRAVAAEVANNPYPFPRTGNTQTLRATWRSQSGFLADVLNFAFWPAYYPEGCAETRADGTERLATDPSLSGAVEDLTYRVVQAIEGLVAFRLQLIALAIADRNEVARQAVGAKYRRAHALWRQTYAEFIAARGLQLRPGITLDQLTWILTCIVEGCVMRSIADPEAEIIDHLEHRTLLGTAALTLLAGCLEPAHDPDGLSVGETLDAIASRGKRQPSHEGKSNETNES